jgi:hypothetical protein
MADDVSASIFTLHQPRPTKAKTPAERARAYRERKRANLPAVIPAPIATPVTPDRPTPSFMSRPPGTVTFSVTPSRRHAAPMLLTVAALALAVVGMVMNAMFAESLGASPTAARLFLALGIAADLAALCLPSCAASLWQARHRATAVAGWAAWATTFIFAVTASIGFASVNIADVTLSRASRVTPAVTEAKASLSDAMAARDRECTHGVGKFCRERETAVTERRQAVDVAMGTVAATADPQTEAAIRIAAWVSRGMLQPTGDDFAMLRLVLLALLPQIGGILLMVGRAERPS